MNKYTLTTIKDIFDKVPTDRVSVCMAELTELILNCKEKKKIMNVIAESIRGDVETIFPESVNWMDDGKGEVVVNTVISVK